MLHQSESGKLLRVNASFDLSNYTELTLTFTDPNGVVTVKTTADGVSLGTVDVDGLNADEYVNYLIEEGLLSAVGTWGVYLTFTNDTTNPNEVFHGVCANFDVAGVTCN